MTIEQVLDAEIIGNLLKLSDDSLDASMREKIARWTVPPSPIEVLEVLDHCINGALGSGFVVTLLQLGYDDACRAAGTSHDQVVRDAKWRERQRI
jgi:hypothetical protein